MDAFQSTSRVHEMNDFMHSTDIESLIDEFTIKSDKQESTNIKQTDKEKGVVKEIPRFYRKRSINVKPILPQKKVETIGNIRRKFEAEQIAKWTPIIQTDHDLIAKCDLSRVCPTIWEEKLKDIVTSQRPMTKTSWETVHKLLKENKHKYLTVDGKKIRLSGSTVKKTENLIYNSFTPVCKKETKPLFENVNENNTLVPVVDPKIIRKRGLLSTLNDTFIPGPLSKKPKLNNNNYNTVEDLKLFSIPSIGLEVYPRIGHKLDSVACIRLNSSRKKNGLIDKKWAEFATSMLAAENEKLSSHIFRLPYENNQNRILFRGDPDFKWKKHSKHSKNNSSLDLSHLNVPLENLDSYVPQDEIESVVVNVLENILSSVSISEVQDDIGVLDDYIPVEVKRLSTTSDVLNKSLKKNRELSRLDVTVIDVSDEAGRDGRKCSKEWCKLGCVCASLESSYMLNEHCGRINCMLNECKCKFGKFDETDKRDGISKTVVANLQHQMNRYLAKEEQKFRRTVIKTKDNTIVIGASRRGQRLPKKFQDFIISENVSEGKKKDRSLPTAIVHLNMLPPNLKIEPFCMVHCLYRCFCKGVMTNGIPIKINEVTPFKDVVNNTSTGKNIIKINQNIPVMGSQPLKVTFRQLRKTDGKVVSSLNLPILVTDKTVTNIEKGKVLLLKRKIDKNPNIESKTRKQSLEKPSINTQVSPKTKRVLRHKSTDTEDTSKSECLIPDNIKSTPKISNLQNSNTLKTSNESSSSVHDNTLSTTANDTMPVKKDSETNKNSYKKNYKHALAEAWKLLQNPEKNLTMSLPDIMFRHVIIYKWKQLVADFQSFNIFLWVTAEEPYRVFATSSGKVRSKLSCLPIVYGKTLKKKILLSHKSLKYILCCDVNAFTYAAFVGRKFAWELLCTFSEHKENSPSDSTSTKYNMENQCFTQFNEFSPNHYPTITSVQGSYSADHIDELITKQNDLSKFKDKEVEFEEIEIDEQTIKNEIIENNNSEKKLGTKTFKMNVSNTDLKRYDLINSQTKPKEIVSKTLSPKTKKITNDVIASKSCNEIKKRKLNIENDSENRSQIIDNNDIKNPVKENIPKGHNQDIKRSKIDKSIDVNVTKSDSQCVKETVAKSQDQVVKTDTIIIPAIEKNPDDCNQEAKKKNTENILESCYQSLDTKLNNADKKLMETITENRSEETRNIKSNNVIKSPCRKYVSIKKNDTSLLKCGLNVMQQNVETSQKQSSSHTKESNLIEPSTSNVQTSKGNVNTTCSLKKPTKYHWLLLNIGAKFQDIRVSSKKFCITYKETMDAMTLADKTGKTCKYPNGTFEGSIPEFGAYAIPGNKNQEIFLGPFVVDEDASIEISRKPVSKLVWGTWTKQLFDPKLIVWNRSDDENCETVFYLQKNRIAPGSIAPAFQVKNNNVKILPKKKIYNFLRIETGERQTTTDPNILFKPAECYKKPVEDVDNNDDEDDVEFVPNSLAIIELSDED